MARKSLRPLGWGALRAKWKLWPAVQLINFRFVPLNIRIVFINIFSIGKLALGPMMRLGVRLTADDE
jgi:hypothetical protein